MSTLPTLPTPKKLSQTADGNLIGMLSVSFYVLFTLLPSSHSLMVSWPWVVVWQVALVLPIVWLLWQLWFKPLAQFKLGSGLDWPIALLVIGLGTSTLFAEFPNQALWYSWAALGGIAALYALSGWLKTPQQAISLLKFQASLGIAFVLVSLGLWLSQTYLPELERLSTLEAYGVSQQFNFGVTSLRNWYPLGHQNYVAGYLVLILPLLFGLAITDKGWQRWLWISGCCLGLVDLYTASSRGGLMALVMTVAISLVIALFRSQLPRRIILPAGSLTLCILIAATLSNSRVRRPLLALLQGRTSSSELGYRMITNVIGWRIGADHPFTGAGPGSVLQLYQKYRPYWAGREAELHFQLHSTPAQLWAELGLWGIAASVSLIGLLGWLTWRWASRASRIDFVPFLPSSVVWSLVAGLFAYGLMGLTDYQLDTLAISGVLLVYLTVLAKVYQIARQVDDSSNSSPMNGQSLKRSRLWASLGLGCLLAISLWLIPVHRAWALSKQGFTQFERGHFDRFEKTLTQAHQLAPWEPYYPSILAWALGDFSYKTNGSSSDALRNASIDWFSTANATAPYSEFGQSNLAWLLLQTQPDLAIANFAKAAQLVPAKQGVFWGLGLALLANNQPQLAIDAMASEILRFPIVVTSPIWQLSELANFREPVFDQLEQQYSQLMLTENLTLLSYWRRMRGTLRWWRGDYNKAAQDWQDFPTGQTLLELAQSNTPTADALPLDLIGRNAMLAWLSPENRRSLIKNSAVRSVDQLPQLNKALPSPELVDQLVITMEQAKSFDDWLKNSNLISQPRSQRLGFGTLSRHIDGPLPTDYYTRTLNQPMSVFFTPMLSFSTFLPELDTALQPKRDELLAAVFDHTNKRNN